MFFFLDITESELDEFRETVYVPVSRIITDAKAILGEKKDIILAGKKGSGVSSLAKHLLLELGKGKDQPRITPIIIGKRITRGLEVVLESDEPCVVYIQSIFVDDEDEIPERWFHTENKHLMIFEMKHEFIRKKTELVRKLGGESVIIDLNSDKYVLTKQDKINLLRVHCLNAKTELKQNIELTEDEINAISDLSPKAGFPTACCEYFSEETGMSPLEYFKKRSEKHSMLKSFAKR